ncbi:hypothetical protein [Mesorhizobium sp. M1396]|uniref:sunset domain-containing protein n=1 Tax=Mesorhizobium sp. M1396 TaxID=2957095 RepID=UPI00333A2063
MGKAVHLKWTGRRRPWWHAHRASHLVMVLALLWFTSVACGDQRQLPRVHSYGTSPSYVAARNMGCDIKGNINERGERIYHIAGQAYYSATRVNPARGERWFCSQWQAWWAGWRKAKV